MRKILLKTGEKTRLDTIMALTDDHELQSELWILLSEKPSLSHKEALESAIDKLKADDLIFRTMGDLLKVQPKTHTIVLLDSLRPIERSIVVMMMLGLSQDTICRYNQLSYIRYSQAVNAVASSKAWSNFVEEEAKFRSETRPRRRPCKGS